MHEAYSRPNRGSALQTYWLLLAVSQDQPKNKYVAELRDCCERAALEGSWVCSLVSMHTPVMPATFGCLFTSCSAVINVSSKLGVLHVCACRAATGCRPTIPSSVECYIYCLFVAGSAIQADQAAAPKPSPQQRLAAQLPHQPWPAHPLPVREAAVRASGTNVQSGHPS